MNYGIATPSTTAGSLMVLAPTADSIPATFNSVHIDGDQHAHLLAEVQRLRGSVYLDDGAISRAQLSPDGRHIQEADKHSWHVISVQPDGTVTGCARYRPHPREVTPEDLGVWQAALAHDPRWHSTLREAIANEIDVARCQNIDFVEVGGWAVARVRRGTMHAFETAVSAYALASQLGGCIGITTATVRHCSSRILRKLGGRSLEAAGLTLPSYFDDRYGCEMELLRFESRSLNRRYGAAVDRLFSRFPDVRVIAAPAAPAVADVRPAASAIATFAERFLRSFVPQEGYAAAV